VRLLIKLKRSLVIRRVSTIYIVNREREQNTRHLVDVPIHWEHHSQTRGPGPHPQGSFILDSRNRVRDGQLGTIKGAFVVLFPDHPWGSATRWKLGFCTFALESASEMWQSGGLQVILSHDMT
jgi:hypothetical protein